MDACKWIIVAGNVAVVYSYAGSRLNEETTTAPSIERTGSESGMLALVWYVMTFGALIIFFTFLSCSGGLCRRMPPTQVILPLETPMSARKSRTPLEKPPAYELFAPPAYDTVVHEATSSSNNKKPECSVFTISSG